MGDLSGATILELAAANPSEIVADLQKAANRWLTWPFAMAGFLLVGMVVAPYGLILLILGAPVVWWLWQWDKARRSVVVFYEVDDLSAGPFDQLVSAHSALSQTHRVWNVEAEGYLRTMHQRKVNAGASSLVSRVAASLAGSGPEVLVTNILVPTLNSPRRAVYFLPDRILVREGKRFADVAYASLNVQVESNQFIESGPVPADSQQVGTTWQYVNKNGGPDRRFNNNRQLPIMRYGTLTLANTSNFLMVWEFSRPDVAGHFAQAVRTMVQFAPRQAPSGVLVGPTGWTPPTSSAPTPPASPQPSEIHVAPQLGAALISPQSIGSRQPGPPPGRPSSARTPTSTMGPAPVARVPHPALSPPVDRPEPTRPVVIAKTLMLISAGLTLVAGILMAWLTSDDRNYIDDAGRQYPLWVTVIAFLLLSLPPATVVAVLGLLVPTRNWIRVTAVVVLFVGGPACCLLGGLGGPIWASEALGTGLKVGYVVLGVLGLSSATLSVVAGVLLVLPRSNTYYGNLRRWHQIVDGGVAY